jgi:UV damage endonuclease UvdE
MDKPIVLIDGTSFHYYRVTATISWCKKTGNNLYDYLIPHYFGCINKLKKCIKNIDISDMIFVRDCPRNEIWRNSYYPLYKGNRSESSPSNDIGTNIKKLNSTCIKYYKKCIRINQMEADDIIAVLARWYQINTNKLIYIITCDSDLYQLIDDRTTIFNPRGSWKHIIDPICIDNKVIKGDRSDNIPSSKSNGYLLNKLLIDLYYIPMSLKQKVWNTEGFDHREIQLGLVCLNTELRKKGIFCSRKPILRTMEEKGIDYWKTICLQNCSDLFTMLRWNLENNIHVMRISSGLFPHYSNNRVSWNKDMNLDFAKKQLADIGFFAISNNIRLTFHPGQYNVVGSPNETAFQNTVRELDYHAELLDTMCCPPDSVMVVHGGGIYNDKEKTKARWVSNYKTLPERVKRRLVLENCEKCFNIVDCLDIAEQIDIPVVFDTHHFECYQILHPKESFKDPSFYMEQICDTWIRKNLKPKFHVSEQRVGSKTGAHSDLIDKIPQYLLDIPTLHNIYI